MTGLNTQIGIFPLPSFLWGGKKKEKENITLFAQGAQRLALMPQGQSLPILSPSSVLSQPGCCHYREGEMLRFQCAAS